MKTKYIKIKVNENDNIFRTSNQFSNWCMNKPFESKKVKYVTKRIMKLISYTVESIFFLFYLLIYIFYITKITNIHNKITCVSISIQLNVQSFQRAYSLLQT